MVFIKAVAWTLQSLLAGGILLLAAGCGHSDRTPSAGHRRALKVRGYDLCLRWVPAGTVKFSDLTGAAEDVSVDNGFWLQETECAQALWLSFMNDNPSGVRGGEYPVAELRVEECLSFIGKLQEELGSVRCRLPTEAEWALACQMGGSSNWGEKDWIDYAWMMGNSPKGQHRVFRTQPVATRRADALGLHDLIGNVGEYCTHPIAAGAAVAPTLPVREGESSGPVAVVRGGNWYSESVKSARLGRSFAPYRAGAPGKGGAKDEALGSRGQAAVGFRMVLEFDSSEAGTKLRNP